MPTINQLVRKNRSDKKRKSKSPVLGIGLNSIQKKDRKSVVQGKSVDLGGRRIIKKKKRKI